MTRSRRFNTKLLCALTGLVVSLSMIFESGIVTQAGKYNCLDELSGGIASIMAPGATNTSAVIDATAQELNLTIAEEEQSTLVMANVKNALNVRSDANEEADKVGKLYKDCGGTILERKDGWTKLQSGNLIGWASDEYLLFGEEAQELAADVGRMIATVNTETLRVRKEADTEAEIYGLLPKGEIIDVVSGEDSEWVCIDYEGNDGYVSAEYVDMNFKIDSGETLEEIKAREAAEKAAKQEAARHVKYGEFTADADTTLLLAALIQCEAGGESYEGQVAVGAVVMNRVRSGAYPNTVHGVIYASGQFTPAMSGKVDRVYASGKIQDSCIRAAEDALAGNSPVGDLTHFRRNNGREGLVLGHHVFY